MQITVFGASGKVGLHVVREALNRGYTVVAFVHGEPHLGGHKNLRIIQGDVSSAASVLRALVGSSAVISTLGSWGTPKKNILETGMRHIIPAMKAQRIQRIVSLTGADARASGDRLGLLHRLTHTMLKVVGRKVLRDGERHIRLLEKSGLKWTVVRSPIMNEQGDAISYGLSTERPYPWETIHRHAVALSLLDQLKDQNFVGKAPYIERLQ